MTKLFAFAFALVASFAFSPAKAADLIVPGTGDGLELLQAIAGAYTADNPGSAVFIPPSIGSGGAIAAVGAGRYVLGRIARPLSEAEKAQGLVAVPLLRIPSAIYVHPSAGVKELSTAQLTGIYSGAIQNWKEVGGNDFSVKVVRREEADSTLVVLRASMPGWKDLAITPRSKLATTTQEAISTVQSVEGAIGWGPYSRALESITNVQRINGKHPMDSDYPSAVVLAFVHNSSNPTPEADAFMKFAKSPKAQALILDWGNVPIKDPGT
jgi:phosphate transport system substrate-binding protein